MNVSARSTWTSGGASNVVRRLPTLVSGPYFFFAARIFLRQCLPLLGLRAQQILDLDLLGAKRRLLLAQLHLLEPAQRAQPRVEDVVGLRVAQLEARDQRRLRFVLLAHDADHLVEVEVDDHHAGEQFEPPLDRRQPMARAAQQHFAAMIEPLLQRLAQRDDARDDAVDQHVHVDGDASLQLAELEQLLHQHGGLDVARARLQHDAHVFSRFVADIGEQRRLLLVDEFRQRLDQPRFLHAIGDFRDDADPAAAPRLLFGPARAHARPAAPGAVDLGDGGAVVDQHAAGREVGAGHEVHQRVGRRVGVGDQVQAGVEQFGDVVRRHGGRHADGDALRAVGEQVRRGGGQHDRLLRVAGIIVAPIDGVLVDAFQQQLGEVGEAGLGVAIGGSVVAVDVAKVALTLDEGIARGEILRETDERLVDRLVAVRVERAHNVADNLRAFLERRAGVELQHVHAVEDAPMHRLQPVARVGQRAAHDGGERIGEIALLQRVAQVDLDRFQRRRGEGAEQRGPWRRVNGGKAARQGVKRERR